MPPKRKTQESTSSEEDYDDEEDIILTPSSPATKKLKPTSDEDDYSEEDEKTTRERDIAFARFSSKKKNAPAAIIKDPTPSKRTGRQADATTEKTLLTASDLQSLSHEALIAHILRLQIELAAARNSTTTTASLSATDVAKKVSALRDLMPKALRKHLIWKPACKTGRARFTHDFAVSSPLILDVLFEKANPAKKAWKMKKISADQFQNDIVGEMVEGRVRYDVLYLTGDVTCRWVEEEGVLRVAGFYGKIV